MTTRSIDVATWAGYLPDKLSYLSPTQFELVIAKLPSTKYFATGANIPSVSLNALAQSTRLGIQPQMPGDRVAFSEFNVNFIVDENLENWRELYTWMIQIAPGYDSNEYRKLIGANDRVGQKFDDSGDPKKMYSDMTMVVTTAANNPNRYVRIYDCFPTTLAEVTMDTTTTDNPYVVCNATFAFTYFEIATTS